MANYFINQDDNHTHISLGHLDWAIVTKNVLASIDFQIDFTNQGARVDFDGDGYEISIRDENNVSVGDNVFAIGPSGSLFNSPLFFYRAETVVNAGALTVSSVGSQYCDGLV